MIDTHSHILPGIDDGAEDIEETLRMCRIAAEDGIGCMAATPHAFDGEFLNLADGIRSLVRALNAELTSHRIDLTIVPGMEVRVSAELGHLLDEGKVLTLNEGRYVLLEFHPSQVPAGFHNLAHHLISAGYRIIVAHPEKNSVIQRNPGYLFTLLRRFAPWDVLIQTSADSIVGEAGFRARRTARLLLKHNIVHLIATDAHSSLKRAPRLSRAVDAATGIAGKETALKMVEQVPRAVIEGSDFPEYWEPSNPMRWWRIY